MELEREELRERGEIGELSSILDAMTEAVVITDQRGQISALNAAALSLFGCRAEEAIGRGIDVLLPSLGRAGDRAGAARYLREATGKTAELLGRREDGATIPLEVGVGRIDDGSRRFAVTLRDVSRRKRLEQEFLQSQKLEAIGRLASGVAHDFNNLLMGISGCANIAMAEAGCPTGVRELLGEIVNATDTGASITRQLLEFARKRRPSAEAVELDAAIAGTERMMRHLLDEDVEVAVDLGAASAKVKCDQGQVEQVLVNLIANARDAMPGGGKLTLETREVPAVEISRADREADAERWVALTVSDTGCGIDEETQRYLFEPFFSTKGVGEGSGLGLSTVYGIVEQSGGFIDLRSELGVGTTFSVYLPCAELAEPADARPRESVGRTILLVEDEPMVRASVRHYLERTGYRVLEAPDGPAALTAGREQRGKIDLLLTDIVLPGLSGPRLAVELHAQAPGVPVIYMSAYPTESLISEGRLAPGMMALQKPFTEEALLAMVRSVL